MISQKQVPAAQTLNTWPSRENWITVPESPARPLTYAILPGRGHQEMVWTCRPRTAWLVPERKLVGHQQHLRVLLKDRELLFR